MALSFYAPPVAKMLAYVDCSFTVLSHTDPRFCDCTNIITADMLPLGPEQPDKQKELSLKADWKYVGVPAFVFGNHLLHTSEPVAACNALFMPQQQLPSVFHPPRI